MSLLNKASLIQIPSGYKDGTLYSAKPTNGDGDFTFSRGSNLAATRVSDGLIEKGRENLLLQSNSFDTTWTTANASVTGGQTGYNGSSDAWLQQSTSTFCRLDQNITQTGILTLSAYAKAGTSNFLLLEVTRSGGVFYAWFDLSSGVVGTTSAIDANIESLGNGWYRCSLIGNQTLSGQARLRVADSNGSTVTTTSSNIYIQDAQLESGLVSTDVITTTTTTAQAGILEDMPRLDYSGGASCPSLLLEPQRSNLFEHSEYFGSSDWSKGNVLLTTNSSQSPEGVNNATLMYPTATPSGFAYLYNTTSGSSARYTISAFVKADGKDVCWLYIQGVSAYGIVYFDLSDESIQVVAGSSSTPTGTIEEVNNGWYRITFTLGEDLAISSGSGIGVSDAKGSTSVTQNGEDGILVYGLQIESGSYATSYIPTYGASVTRGADSCSKTGISSLIGQTEGTMYWEGTFQNSQNPILMQLIPSTGNYTSSLYFEYAGGAIKVRVFDSGTTQATFSVSASLNTNYKIAFAYKENNFAAYVNGTSIGTDTSGTVQSGLSEIYLGGLKGNFTEPFTGTKPKKVLVFPTRLSNDELATLTTI